MIPIFEAAWEICGFLKRNKIPYAIIGGFAVQQWGVPRLTVDIDLTVLTPLEQGVENVTQLILAQFPSRVSDPFDLARRARMIIVRTSNGQGIDISLGIPGYTDELIRHAVDYVLEPGKIVHICSAEDLIIHKSVAGRPQDIRDIDGIIARQGNILNVSYVRKWLREFAVLLPDPEVLERFERAWRSVRRTTSHKERKTVRRTKKGD